MRFYNTFTKEKQEFEPLFPGKVGMYSCGPTVYDYFTIGNIRAYVFSDTVRRALEHEGYEVRLIKNITDVGHLTADDIAQGDSGEDKIERKALAEKKTPEEIAHFYEEYFHATEERMNIEPAHFFPRATAHVPGMIKLIESLISRGHAYEVNGNVFYDVTSFPEYGKLSGNTLEHLKVGARLEEHPDKRNPWDFALWLKAPKEHLMKWESPWGMGYPGWHIECSEMSQEYLGDTFDIHTGGEDNIFPHHEAEIAQSEGATGKPFVRNWMHVRHMMVDGEKMSKSKGNFYRLEDIAEKGYSPMDLRMLFLSAHYRSQMNFTWDALAQAKKNKETLFGLMERLQTTTPVIASDPSRDDRSFDADVFRTKFLEAINDDLNTPLALSALLESTNAANAALDQNKAIDTKKILSFLKEAFSIFGLKEESVEVPQEINELARAREEARKGKDFAAADAIRDKLASAGWVVEDTSQGPKVRKK